MSRAAGPSSGERENYLPPGERNELLNELETCDEDAETARQNGEDQQRLAHLERGLYLRRRLYTETSAEVLGACRRLGEACNCVATSMLQKENLRGALDLLKRAEQVTEKCELDRAITWNNLACYYRKTGKLRAAVTYLERALAIEEHGKKGEAAQTHLNLCATLSQLQRHVDALYHAQSALIRTYELLAPLMFSGQLSLSGPGEPGDSGHEQVIVLCIAYHNLAVEHEHLKNNEVAICTYAEGLRWARGFLAPDHQLIGILTDSFEAVKAKLVKATPSCLALKRAAELTEGWGPLRTPASPGQGAEPNHGAQHLGSLITPRDNAGAADENAMPESSSPHSTAKSTQQLGEPSTDTYNTDGHLDNSFR